MPTTYPSRRGNALATHRCVAPQDPRVVRPRSLEPVRKIGLIRLKIATNVLRFRVYPESVHRFRDLEWWEAAGWLVEGAVVAGDQDRVGRLLVVPAGIGPGQLLLTDATDQWEQLRAAVGQQQP
jgi:hypothetical protein